MSISFELFPTKTQHISVESIAKIWSQIMDEKGIIFQLLDVTRQMPSIEEIIQGEEVIKIFTLSRPETIYYLSFFKIDPELDDLETFLGYNYTNLDEVTLTKRLNLFLSIGYSIDLEISSVNEMSANEKQQIILLIAELSSQLNAIVHFRNAFATINSGLHYWNELLLD